MEGEVRKLTDDEVLHILKLIEQSSFDFFELQVGDLKLTVSKGGYRGSSTDKPVHADIADPPPSSRPATSVTETTGETEVGETQAKPGDAAVGESGVPITAPMVGTFYTAPEPGASPFVEVGGTIDEDTTVGLIEVMKVFTAVTSRVRGKIAERCVENGQFVEYGQTLFLVSPEGVSGDKGPSG